MIDCPYDAEVWAVNDGYLTSKRIDKLFLTDVWSEFSVDDLNDAKAKFGCEIIASCPSLDGLAVTLYPIEEILQKFKTRFFTNTICYMIAYALHKGYKRIRLYGVDMMTHTAYIHEKGGVEFWMGVALGMGVEVLNTKGSATGKPVDGKLYGHWGDKAEKVRELEKSFYR